MNKRRLMRNPHQDGFTLVEVLVALVIVALVLAAALRATGLMTTTQQSLKSSTMAGWSADNRLVELRLAHALPDLGQTEAPCPQAELVLVCQTTVTTSPNNVLRRVDVTVALSSEPAHQLAHRMTFISALP